MGVMRNGRLVTATNEQWLNVSSAMQRRLDELGISQADAAAKGRTSPASWGLMQNAKQASYMRSTVLAVCRGLGWTPDSIDRLLNGEEPILTAEAAAASGKGTAHQPTIALSTPGHVDIGDLPDEDQAAIRRAIENARRLHGLAD